MIWYMKSWNHENLMISYENYIWKFDMKHEIRFIWKLHMKITYEIMKWYKLLPMVCGIFQGNRPEGGGAARAALGARRYGPGHGTITYTRIRHWVIFSQPHARLHMTCDQPNVRNMENLMENHEIGRHRQSSRSTGTPTTNLSKTLREMIKSWKSQTRRLENR